MILYQNPLRIVAELHGSEELDVDTRQANRYCIRLNTSLGKEAYYFASPIYNASSRKLVQRRFLPNGSEFCFVGSNCAVAVSGTGIILRQEERNFTLTFPRTQVWQIRDGHLESADYTVYPTCNGICLGGSVERLCFGYSAHVPKQTIRVSKNCLCWMEQQFKPAVVVSALTAGGAGQNVPLVVTSEQASEHTGSIRFSATEPILRRGWMEVHFYEPKLIQDTPVSGRLPTENNAFGSIAFIGKSAFYGAQWLYTRLDVSKMQELRGAYVREMKLYLPCLSGNAAVPELYGLTARFCSFGSNWNNKVGRSEDGGRSVLAIPHFLCLDLTRFYTNRARLTESVGTVLTPSHFGKSGCHVIATGDCGAMPPVLCVKY